MASPEHLKILGQGVEAWNAWRRENPDLQPDFSGADLSKTEIHPILDGTPLGRTFSLLPWPDRGTVAFASNAIHADFSDANFSNANLQRSVIYGANFQGASLNGAIFYGADINGSKFLGADLSKCNMRSGIVSNCDFSEATLDFSNLTYSNLTCCKFSNTSFHETILGETVLTCVNLKEARYLDECVHEFASYVDLKTLEISNPIPLMFLHGVGLPNAFIEFLPSILTQPIQYHSVFISYSAKDEVFAKRLHADLQQAGVRCWFAPHDLPIGERIRKGIDEAIHLHDKVLLILSENGISSDWVEKEVETAFERERKEDRTMLFPVRIDETVMDTSEAWAADIRRTRNIGDFTGWTDPEKYKDNFNRVLRDLKAEIEKK